MWIGEGNSSSATMRPLTTVTCLPLIVHDALCSGCHRSTCMSTSGSSSAFVPQHKPCTVRELEHLRNFLDDPSRRLLVLTGAGISTESGIPDYRSEGIGLYMRPGVKRSEPIQIARFLKSHEARCRYWARNFVGWNRFSALQPNEGHRRLFELQKRPGKVSLLVTQNVDGLHQKAGSTDALELHGTAHVVVCLSCSRKIGRHEVQRHMLEENPSIAISLADIQMRPDGDVDLPSEFLEEFRSPTCRACGGILKTDIVFFGDSVPKNRVDRIYEAMSDSRGLFVVGSSLQVYSGYRLALAAHEQRKPIVILNIGKTRADHLATHKVSGRCGSVLSQVIRCKENMDSL